MNDDDFLREAIRLSRQHMQAGDGGPFGSVVVRGGEVISQGWNRVTSTNDPTAHAEVEAIRAACARLRTFSLAGCVLYASCEPCPMCLAAAYWARVDRLVYAAAREDAAGAGFDDAELYTELVLTPEKRRLPSLQSLRSEAQDVFEEWLKLPQRIPY